MNTHYLRSALVGLFAVSGIVACTMGTADGENVGASEDKLPMGLYPCGKPVIGSTDAVTYINTNLVNDGVYPDGGASQVLADIVAGVVKPGLDGLVEFNGTYISPEERAAIGAACKAQYPTDMLGQIACVVAKMNRDAELLLPTWKDTGGNPVTPLGGTYCQYVHYNSAWILNQLLPSGYVAGTKCVGSSENTHCMLIIYKVEYTPDGPVYTPWLLVDGNQTNWVNSCGYVEIHPYNYAQPSYVGQQLPLARDQCNARTGTVQHSFFHSRGSAYWSSDAIASAARACQTIATQAAGGCSVMSGTVVPANGGPMANQRCKTLGFGGTFSDEVADCQCEADFCCLFGAQPAMGGTVTVKAPTPVPAN